jgi:hypothetical protein
VKRISLGGLAQAVVPVTIGFKVALTITGTVQPLALAIILAVQAFWWPLLVLTYSGH